MEDHKYKRLLKPSLVETDCWKEVVKELEHRSDILHKAGHKYHLFATCYLGYYDNILDRKIGRVILEITLYCYKEELKELVVVHSFTAPLHKWAIDKEGETEKDLSTKHTFLCKKLIQMLKQKQLHKYIHGRDTEDKFCPDSYYSTVTRKSPIRGKRSVLGLHP